MPFLFIFLLITVLDPGGFFGSDKVWDAVSIIALFAGCIRYFPIRNSKIFYIPIFNVKGILLFTLFLALMIISLFRTHSFLNSDFTILKNTTILVLLPIFLYLCYQYESYKDEFFERKMVIMIINVLGIFVLVNIISFILNPTFSTESATTFRFIGINTKRIVFPLNPDVHPNTFGTLGGYLLVMSVAFLKHVSDIVPKLRTRLYVYAVSGIIVILMSDSRGILFSAILCLAVMFMLHSFNKLNIIKYAVWLIPFSNIIFMSFLEYTASTSAASSLSRNNGSDIATGNSRKFIYMAANNELADFKPIHMIGFGEYGPYGAGLTKYYMEEKFLMESEAEKLISSITHNTALQLIFDIGYIGLAVYMLLLLTLFSHVYKLYKKRSPSLMAISYLIVYIILMGTSETFYGNYIPFRNYLFIVLTFFVIITYNAYLYRKQVQPKKYEPAVVEE
jgi:O-antigen ligase